MLDSSKNVERQRGDAKIELSIWGLMVLMRKTNQRTYGMGREATYFFCRHVTLFFSGLAQNTRISRDMTYTSALDNIHGTGRPNGTQTTTLMYHLHCGEEYKHIGGTCI